jgi:hypothetical protein
VNYLAVRFTLSAKVHMQDWMSLVASEAVGVSVTTPDYQYDAVASDVPQELLAFRIGPLQMLD